jgi:urease accessory protein
MLIQNRAPRGSLATKSLTLTFDQRCRSRLRTTLDDGTPASLLLERGTVLRGGDMLVADEGSVIAVHAADELVSTVHASDAFALTFAAYHLGNRHVPLQIAREWLRYQHDHVLDEMVIGLGLEVAVEHAAFEPVEGPYTGAHRYAHAFEHGHDHGTAR